MRYNRLVQEAQLSKTTFFLNFFYSTFLFIDHCCFECHSIQKNKIYHKMQREKLYNLQIKVYFNCILFVFKKSKTLSDQFFVVAKTDRTEFGVFLNMKSTEIK
jgi:hypothetical protein